MLSRVSSHQSIISAIYIMAYYLSFRQSQPEKNTTSQKRLKKTKSIQQSDICSMMLSVVSYGRSLPSAHVYEASLAPCSFYLLS